MLAGAVQLNSTGDTERNLATAERLVRRAAGMGAELILLPEKWTALGERGAQERAVQPPDGATARWAAGLARELDVDLVAGSYLEREPGDRVPRNASLHFGPDGGLRARYCKLHLFDVEVDGTVYAESDHERAGEEVVLSELADGSRLGMSICYDIRFPELYRALVEGGAEVLCVPSAFTLATTRDHWEVLLRARAIENACFVVAANQIGAHGDGTRSGGRSMIVDPWGVVLATAPDEESVIVAELSLERLRDVRRRLPSFSHRRPELYAAPSSGISA